MSLRRYLVKATYAAVVVGVGMGIGVRVHALIPQTDGWFTWARWADVAARIVILLFGLLAWRPFRLPRRYPTRSFRISTASFGVPAAIVMALVAYSSLWGRLGLPGPHGEFVVWLGAMVLLLRAALGFDGPHEIDRQMYREEATKEVYRLIADAARRGADELRLVPQLRRGRTTSKALLAVAHVKGRLDTIGRYQVGWEGEIIVEEMRRFAQMHPSPAEFQFESRHALVPPMLVTLSFPTTLPPIHEPMVIGISTATLGQQELPL